MTGASQFVDAVGNTTAQEADSNGRTGVVLQFDDEYVIETSRLGGAT